MGYYNGKQEDLKVLLHDNKNKVLGYVDKVISEGVDIPNVTVKQRQSQVKQFFDQENYTEALDSLLEIKDNRIGIAWSVSKDLGNGTQALVRDARSQTQEQHNKLLVNLQRRTPCSLLICIVELSML
ncbi:MAG: hypothetical protein DGJ47_000129 [Rickettsiaceae bacterium]